MGQLAVVPAAGTLGPVYLGVFPTAIAFITCAYGLARIEAQKLAATIYLVPACALCLCGVATRRRR